MRDRTRMDVERLMELIKQFRLVQKVPAAGLELDLSRNDVSIIEDCMLHMLGTLIKEGVVDAA